MSSTTHTPALRHSVPEDDPLDASVAPAPVLQKGRPAWLGVAQAMIFPLFFVVMFSLCYVSAFHAPTPNNAPLYVVGSSAQTSQIVSALDKQASGAFDVKTTTSLDVATDAVKNREAIGAIQLGSPVTTVIASGGGGIAASTVEKIATSIQAQEQAAIDKQTAGFPAGQATNVTVGLKQVDVAPLASTDTTGTALFYFFIICTIAGYLTVTILAQVGGKLRLRGKYLTVGIAAILAPPITFALSSIFVGNYGLDVGQVFGLLGIGAFYVFTVGAVTLLANQIAGQAAIFLVLLLNIFINFPSSGGAIPAAFLPGFWQAIHSFWFGAGSMDAIRDLVYFHGMGGMWASLSHTAIWLIAALALSAVLGIRRAATIAPPESLARTEAPEHARHAESSAVGV